jgi:hypothetical protein
MNDLTDLTPGAIYYTGSGMKGVVVAVIDTLEVHGQFPTFVVVEHFDRKGDVWMSDGMYLACDDDGGTDVSEDTLLDTFERGTGETWEQAIKREISEGLCDYDDGEDYSYELGAEAFARGGMTGYNEAMGYGTVDDPDEYDY